MKTRYAMVLVGLLAIFLLACSSENKEDIQEVSKNEIPTVEVQTYCSMAEQIDKLTKKFPQSKMIDVTFDEMKNGGVKVNDTEHEALFIMVETKIGPDGQINNGSYHDYLYFITFIQSDETKCQLLNIRTTTYNGDEKLVETYGNYQKMSKRIDFYYQGQLMYYKVPLKNKMWQTVYLRYQDIAVRVPNWAAQKGEDYYLTWVGVGPREGEEMTIHLPVWAIEAVWTEFNGFPTLMAGQIAFVNPHKNHTMTEADLIYAIRLNAKNEVDERGVLIPVSMETYEAYIRYMQGAEIGWQRYLDKDEEYSNFFYKGLAKTWNKKKFRKLSDVFNDRGAGERSEDEKTDDFKPKFFVTPPVTL